MMCCRTITVSNSMMKSTSSGATEKALTSTRRGKQNIQVHRRLKTCTMGKGVMGKEVTVKGSQYLMMMMMMMTMIYMAKAAEKLAAESSNQSPFGSPDRPTQHPLLPYPSPATIPPAFHLACLLILRIFHQRQILPSSHRQTSRAAFPR
jgi:hypothetical protein